MPPKCAASYWPGRFWLTTVQKPVFAFRRISIIAKTNVTLRLRKSRTFSRHGLGKNMPQRSRMLDEGT